LEHLSTRKNIPGNKIDDETISLVKWEIHTSNSVRFQQD